MVRPKNERQQMNNFENEIGKTANRIASRLGWFGALLLTAVVSGCGSGGGDAILGGVGVLPPVQIVAGPSGIILPGDVCAISGVDIPTVTATDPTNGNSSVTTSTGIAGGGKSISATFSLPMNPATINTTSVTLTPSGGSVLIPASIAYGASTNVATLTTSAALLPLTTYTGSISAAVTSSKGFNMPCAITWSFTTTTLPSVGLAPVNLGTATPFAIASAAGLTNTPTVPLSHINGNVVLDPTATCNAVAVNTAGGFGLCGGMAPILTGTVISPLFNKGVTSASIMADLKSAYNSILPANLPGATVLGCGTIGSAGAAGAGLGCSGNATLPPGVYISATNSSIGVTGTLTLDGKGDTNSRFVFQAASTLTTAAATVPGVAASQIVLINGAKASNVWWQVGSSATIGTYSIFNGNILADTTITMGAGSTSCGRLLAGAVTTSGAFTFDTNIVSVPGNPFSPAGCQ